jgi:molybdopterin synthase sulfur carrier subunit
MEEEMMQITVKLNASLRQYVKFVSNDGTLLLEMEENATAREIVQKLAIPLEKVKMILLNGKGVGLDTILNEGDRIALFPPEMAFNMYVALSFRRDLGKKNLDQEGN